MTAISAIVRLDQVDVEIRCRPILHDISLEIARGGHLGLVGGNGSGKSTLLALIAGRRWPAPGRGRRRYDFGTGPETDAVTARTRIALIGPELQDSYVARRWNFRVRDIVRSGLTRSDIPTRRITAAETAAADALLRSMQLTDLADRRLLELSRGEQRRVLITRALAFEPALLLLDEPYSGLDHAARERLTATLAIAAAQTTLVIAAHSEAELPAFVTRTGEISNGRMHMRARTHAVPASGMEARADNGGRGPAAAASGARPVAVSGVLPAQAAKPLIELIGASVWLDGRQALADLDWRLEHGDHWLIEGPNGAGKSTLLRLLHGELRPALGGHIGWPGLGDPPDVWALRQRVTLVSPELQSRYLYPTTVFDAVASGLHASIGAVRPLSAEQSDRVRAVLDALELEPLAARMLTSLSYGQRRRALIARTLVTDPRVVLLDEPWEGLDAGTTALIVRELVRRIDLGLGVVCVSHVGPRGLALNQVLRLDRGRVRHAGDSAGLRGNSASAQIRAADCPPH